MPPHPTLFLRRSLYERFGLFDTRYRIAADYDLMLRMLMQLSGRVQYLPEVLVRMRVGGVSNRSPRNLLRKSWEDDQALRANQVGGLGRWRGRTSPSCHSLFTGKPRCRSSTTAPSTASPAPATSCAWSTGARC